MSNNLVSTLRRIKPDLDSRNLLPSRPWTPPASLKATDIEGFSKKINGVMALDLAQLEKKKKAAGDYINAQMTEIRRQKKILDESTQKLEASKKGLSADVQKKEIERVMKNLLITHYEFVEPAVTIFTTEFLKKKGIVLGIFRIWIDWAQSDPSCAIKIVNLYKADNNIDHPCLLQGNLCMGSFDSEIKRNYQEKNLFALLETLVSFISQDNVGRGYRTSYASWNTGAVIRKTPFQFEQYNIRPTPLNSDQRSVIEGINHLMDPISQMNNGNLQNSVMGGAGGNGSGGGGPVAVDGQSAANVPF